MLLCSLITYAAVELIDVYHQAPQFHTKTAFSFLYCITFIHPSIWNAILQRNDISFIDGVYWTLWVEVVFYVTAGVVFFLAKSDFVRNWLFIALGLQCIRAVTSPVLFGYIPFVDVIATDVYGFLIWMGCSYWIYFSYGIVMFALYTKRRITISQWVMMCLLILFELYTLKSGIMKVLFIVVMMLFVLVVYKPKFVSWLSNPLILRIGVSSYPLYLLHESIGVLLLLKIKDHSPPNPIGFISSLIIIVGLMFFSYLIYKYYELPLFRKAKQLLVYI